MKKETQEISLCLRMSFLRENLRKTSLSQLVKLGIVLITDHDSSWMKMMSVENWVLRIVLIRKLFFWTFCKKIYNDSKIILGPHSQLNTLTWFDFDEVLDIFWSATPCWSSSARKSMYWSWLDNHLYSWCTWMYAGIVCLALFPNREDLSWS